MASQLEHQDFFENVSDIANHILKEIKPFSEILPSQTKQKRNPETKVLAFEVS